MDEAPIEVEPPTGDDDVEAAEEAPELRLDGVSPSDARLRKLADLRAGNAVGLQRLHEQRATFDSRKIRLETLIDLILDDDDRLTFEVTYEQRCAQAIAMAMQQVAEVREQQRRVAAQQALLAGVRPTTPAPMAAGALRSGARPRR